MRTRTAHATFSVGGAVASFSTGGASAAFSTRGASSTFATRNPSASMSTKSAAMAANAGTVVYGGVDDYTGAYAADALFSEQVFATRQKRMTDDFTVHAINYTEAPNDCGVTLTIGG